MRTNGAFTIAFEVIYEGQMPTVKQMKAAVLKRLFTMSDDDWRENMDPYYEQDPDEYGLSLFFEKPELTPEKIIISDNPKDDSELSLYDKNVKSLFEIMIVNLSQTEEND